MTATFPLVVQRLMAVLGTALVLQFFSEFYFMNEGPAMQAARGLAALPELGAMTLWYMLFASAFLIVLERFEVGTVAGLLLAGAVFGWVTEGVVVPVVHEAPPISFIWPSVSWHALVDVMGGWFLLRLAMRRLALPWLVVLFAGLGVVWAFWASWTWGPADTGEVIFSPEDFGVIVALSATGWVIGTVLADLGAKGAVRASRLEIGVTLLLICGLFGVTGLAYLPSAVALAVLVLVTLYALARARRGGGQTAGVLTPLAAPPPLRNYLALPVLPVAAVLTYPVVHAQRLAIPADEIIPLLLLTGAVAFLWALFVAFRAGRAG